MQINVSPPIGLHHIFRIQMVSFINWSKTVYANEARSRQETIKKSVISSSYLTMRKKINNMKRQ